MTGLDADLLARFLVADDPGQGARARAVIARLSGAAPGFVGREAMVELVRVLERAHGCGRAEIAGAVEGLLAAREIAVETPDRVARAADRYRGGADFAAEMVRLAAEAAGCDAVAGLDRAAAPRPGAGLP